MVVVSSLHSWQLRSSPGGWGATQWAAVACRPPPSSPPPRLPPGWNPVRIRNPPFFFSDRGQRGKKISEFRINDHSTFLSVSHTFSLLTFSLSLSPPPPPPPVPFTSLFTHCSRRHLCALPLSHHCLYSIFHISPPFSLIQIDQYKLLALDRFFSFMLIYHHPHCFLSPPFFSSSNPLCSFTASLQITSTGPPPASRCKKYIFLFVPFFLVPSRGGK